jgi:hypothetical protein
MGAESMSAPQNEKIDELCKRNSSNEWILSKKKFLTGYTVNRRKKYPFGIVNINMTLTADVIEDITISGDFFEKAPVEELEALLKGRKVTSVDNIDVSKFIANMTSGEFAELIKG